MVETGAPNEASEELAKACREGEEGHVRAILGRQDGAAVKWDPWGPGEQTPLMWAAREGHLGVVKLLLEEEDDADLRERLNMQVSPSSRPALHVGLHDKYDGDAACQSSCGRTAILSACLAGHEEVVYYLLEKGAWPWAVDNGCWNVLNAASCRGYVTTVRRLIQAYPTTTRSYAACPPRPRLSETTQAAASAIISVRWSPLYLAAANDHAEVVRALVVEGGVSVSEGEMDPCPWAEARRLGNWRCLEVLQVSEGREAELLRK